MKSKISLIKKVLTGIIVILCIFVANPITAKADELYFDDDGNLYYVTREKKAMGGIGYMTIGWIIKRYDMPIDANGQQYVIVTKTTYKPDEVDPNDSSYIFSYFKSDRNEILTAVRQKSIEWYNILINYGDTVYIDSVMTVTNGSTPLGTLYEGGSYEGEVYFTFEGIAGARGWSSKESIKTNFDLSVRFNSTYKPPEMKLEITDTEDVYIGSSTYNSLYIESDEFDMLKGIPSGEKLKIYGMITPAICNLKLKRVQGRMTVTIPVYVTYILKWTDYYGNPKEETRQIPKYYTVEREFSYYTYEGYELHEIDEVYAISDVIGGEVSLNMSIFDNTDIDKGSIVYGLLTNHIKGYDIQNSGNVETVTITSDSYLKPAIPEGDYSQFAEVLVGDVKVVSDKIVIEDALVLSDEANYGKGCEPEKNIYITPVELAETSVDIPKETKNGYSYEILGKAVYEDLNGEKKEQNISGVTGITVHTPVLCNVNIKCSKSKNQAVTPSINDVVLGSSFMVSFDDFGNHINLPGYGLRSYGKYVGKRQVSCTFDAYYNGVLYKAGQWIDIDNIYADITPCEYNNEGVYKVYGRTLAYNAPKDINENSIGEGLNKTPHTYGAYVEKEVRLIGSIEKLNVTDGKDVLWADKLPMNSSNENGIYIVTISTTGDIKNTDYLSVYYSYYLEKADGSIIPVNVYEVSDRDQIVGEHIKELIHSEAWDRNLCNIIGNKGTWSKEFVLPYEYIVVADNVDEKTIKEAIKQGQADKYILNGGSLVVAAEFVRYKDGIPYISYVNEENGRKGYCNKWLEEGGNTKLPYGVLLKTNVSDKDYYDYEVSGTH